MWKLSELELLACFLIILAKLVWSKLRLVIHYIVHTELYVFFFNIWISYWSFNIWIFNIWISCFCVETELRVWICLVEIEQVGVISLLPDNLSEIGVEYDEVSYSLHCSYWIICLFFFFLLYIVFKFAFMLGVLISWYIVVFCSQIWIFFFYL